MRFYINEDKLDDEEVFNNPAGYAPVHGSPIYLIKGRALPAPLWLNDEAINPFDQMIMSYLNGTLSTHYQTPRVVEKALPQTNKMEPMFRAPMVIATVTP